MLLQLELKTCRTLWSGNMAYMGFSADLLGKGPAVLGLRYIRLRKEVPIEQKGQYLVLTV